MHVLLTLTFSLFVFREFVCFFPFKGTSFFLFIINAEKEDGRCGPASAPLVTLATTGAGGKPVCLGQLLLNVALAWLRSSLVALLCRLLPHPEQKSQDSEQILLQLLHDRTIFPEERAYRMVLAQHGAYAYGFWREISLASPGRTWNGPRFHGSLFEGYYDFF